MNKCGECTVCCGVFSIPQLSKPKNKMCGHCADGCSIYEDRPDPCRDFACAWLVGNWRKELRPDLSGIMIQNTPDGYEALQIQDDVDQLILDQIDYIEVNYGVNIKRVDARKIA